MKKLILLVLVGAVGYLGYVLFERQNLARFGISSEHPLGEFEKLDAILTGEMKLPKSSVSTLGNVGVRPTARMFQYTDPDNRYVHLVLLLDRQNNLQGVAGWYLTPDNSPVAPFMEGHWRRTGGPRSPQFTGAPPMVVPGPSIGGVPPTLVNSSQSRAEFTKGPVKGTWVQTRDEGERRYTYWHIYLRME